MNFKIKILGLLVAIALPIGASAADYVSSKNPSETVTKSNIDSLYIVNNQINIDSNLQNELYAAGQNVTVNGQVADSAFIASNYVTTNGSVGDSLKVAGSTININGNVGSDLFFAGSTVNISKNVVITDDLSGVAGFVSIDGKVGKNVKIAGTTVEINGEIDGDAFVIADNVKIGNQAVIKGTLDYRSPKEAEIASGAQIQDIQFHKSVSKSNTASEKFKEAFTSFNLIKVFAAIILGLLLIYIFPKNSEKIVRDGFAELGRNVLVGLITAVIIPIALIILLASVFGYQVALLSGSVYLTIYLTASAYTGILLGSLIVKLFDKQDYKADWKAVIIGQILFAILVLVPFVGWIINLFLFLVVLGSILKLTYQSVKKAHR